MKPIFMNHLPECLRLEVEEDHAAVVGGAIRAMYEGMSPKDIDVFVFSKANHRRLCNKLCTDPKKDAEEFVSVLSGGSVLVELVCLPGCDSAMACHQHADFNIAAGVYSAGQLLLPAGFEEDVCHKHLRFLGETINPRHSYDRYLRYNREYGYRIDSSIQELLRMWQEE